MGRIIVGFPCIGKSSLKEAGWIDLRSDCFWVGEEDMKVRPIGWYESFCNVAIDLANQGYNVLVPSHEAIRRYLKSKNQEYITVFPDPSLKEEWIQKCFDRYKNNPDRETLAAYEAVKDHWDEFMNDLKCELPAIIIQNMDYSLKYLLDNADKF